MPTEVPIKQSPLRPAPPLQAITLCINTHGCYKNAPFHTTLAGQGQLLLATVSSHAPSLTDASPAQWLSSHPLAQSLLGVPGLNAAHSKSADAFLHALYVKLAVSCCINPLTALLDVPNGAVADQPAAVQLMATVCAEVCSVCPPHLAARPDQLLASVQSVGRGTGGNVSSMLQDVRAGRGTEVAYLNGYVARQAAARGMAAPVNGALLQLLMAKEAMYGHARGGDRGAGREALDDGWISSLKTPRLSPAEC